MADEFNQEQADGRHRSRRERLQRLRNDMGDLLNEYYDDFPESEAGEREMEYRIEQRLRTLQREIDSFLREQRQG